MTLITYNSQSYQIDGKPVYLLSGEFHYFRVPKVDWRERMRLFKAAGGNCLATYIPWLLHESEEGHFRFSGEDWLDLEEFLQTAQSEGLYVIARPGPYQYSELVYHGLPAWLVRDYPETLALTATGEVIGYASISYTHPVFLAKVRSWFDQVLPILARYTHSSGGPIIFVQVDNETVGIHEWFGSLDYHPTTMGIGQAGGAYPRFLAARYQNIAALNQAYETRAASFEQVSPVPGEQQSALARARWRKDYFDFYLDAIADYFAILVEMVRSHGIDCPIMHNSGNPGMNAYFIETIERLGSQFVLGSDHYYNLDQTWPQNHPTPQYAVKSFISLEMLRLMGFPPSVLEIPGGSASNWPPVLPSDALACYMTNLAFGMKGSNYYIFTGGPNPPGAGNTTDLYDYDAGISASGEVRPLYLAQKQFGELVQSHPGWLTARRLADFRVGLDFEYQRADTYWKDDGPCLFGPPEASRFLRAGLLSTALCAGLSPEMVNLDAQDWAAQTDLPLVIVSAASMSAAKQQRVIDFLKNGGRALITPILPDLNEQFQPCTLLADYLGVPRQQKNRRGLARPRVGAVVNVNGSAFPFTQVPERAAIIGMDEISGSPIALSIRPAGGGQAIILGLRWVQAMREHERMLVEILETLGIKRVLSLGNPNVWACAYTSGSQPTVFLLNLFTASQEVDLTVQVNGGALSLGKVEVGPVSVKVVET